MKLSVKISALVLFLSLLFAVTFIGLNQFFLQQYLSDSQSEWVNTLTFTIAEGISLDTINGNALHAREQLKAIVHIDEALEYAYVTDFDGELFTHTFDQGFPRHLLKNIGLQHDAGSSITRFSSKDGNIDEIDIPLIEGMRAHLYVGVNQNEITNLIGQTKSDIFWASLLLTLLGTSIAIVLGRRISAPLAQLSTWMETHGKGEIQEELILEKADSEVNNLVKTLNTMIKGRSKLELALKRSNDELEGRVKSRTEDFLRAKDEAERANQAKSEFLSSMSHELRTPLNAILGFSQLLEMDSQDELSKKNIREIYSAGRHLLSLIEEILDLSKIEAGNIDISKEVIELNHILNDCLTLIKPMFVKQDIRIIDNITSRSFHAIQADQTRFKQVLLNLLSNAVKYNRHGGSITLNCDIVSDKRLRISITDTGKGLDAEQQQKLFIPFERIGAETTEIEGTGIGLVITKRLIEKMGGVIGVDSQSGVGSTFFIELDLAENST